MKYFTQKNLLYLFGILFVATAISSIAGWAIPIMILGLLLSITALLFILTLVWERKDRPKNEKILWTTTGISLLVTIFFGVFKLPGIMWLFAFTTIISGLVLGYVIIKNNSNEV